MPVTENSHSTSSLFTFPLGRKQPVDSWYLNLPLKWGFSFSHSCCQLFHGGRFGTFGSHKAYKWVLHGDEILHCCHSKNVCFEKNVLCSVKISPTHISLYLCYWSLNFFFSLGKHDNHYTTKTAFFVVVVVNADAYKVTSHSISVYIWHACLQTQLNWPLFFFSLMTHQQLVS